MADFAPPTGPPPPKVPEGWKAIWNDQYKEWFYANIYTKQTQWDRPTEPVYPPPAGESADGPPPYIPGESKPVTADKTGLSSNNPYAAGGAGNRPSNDLNEDERLARQLQAEEDARVQSGGQPQQGGAANSYYQGNNQAPGYGPGVGASAQPNPYTGQYDNTTAEKSSGKGGLLGKLKSKIAAAGAGGSHGGSHGGMMGQSGYGYGQSGYGQQPMYAQHGGYYPPAGGPFGRPARRPGMGPGAGLAMGGAAGLAGGMMLASAADGFGGDDGGYGGDDGGGFGGDDGGGFGGDGGDFGGGDMGGGDFGGGDF